MNRQRKHYFVAPLLWGCLVSAGLIGCTTETVLEDGTVVRDRSIQKSAFQKDPKVEAMVDAPPALRTLADHLLEFRAKYGFMPESLVSLRQAGLIEPDAFTDLEEFAYQAGGLGVLSDGRIITLIDTQIRIDGLVWCVWSEPTPRQKPEVYTVGAVPFHELERAAAG